jgi:hypothetical protein
MVPEIKKPETSPDDFYEKSLDKLAQEVEGIQIENIIPPKKTTVSKKDIIGIIERISRVYNIPESTALISIYLLILVGAAISATPVSLSVTVKNAKGHNIEVDKLQLLTAYKQITGNSYLRRLAETLADDISKFAEKHNIKGDLANKMNNKLLAEGKTVLSTRQMAWCSSFNQDNPTLNSNSELVIVAQLLAEDYKKRFDKVQNKTSKPKPKSSPKRQGQNKGKTKKKILTNN